MRVYISALQVIFLVGLFAAIGGKTGALATAGATFSLWGAGAGGALAIAGAAIAWPFLRKGRVGESLSPVGRYVLGASTVAVLSVFLFATIFMYTQADWAFLLLKIAGVVAMISIVAAMIVAWTGLGSGNV